MSKRKSSGRSKKTRMMYFGKRRSSTRRKSSKTSKKAAMKAFRSFYKRHCAGARSRGMRFGGGNPDLSKSMGYEFCPGGMGGVLGYNSTGMFPSPCTPLNKEAAAAEGEANLPVYNMSSIGRRRRRARSPMIGATRRRRARRSVMNYFGAAGIDTALGIGMKNAYIRPTQTQRQAQTVNPQKIKGKIENSLQRLYGIDMKISPNSVFGRRRRARRMV